MTIRPLYYKREFTSSTNVNLPKYNPQNNGYPIQTILKSYGIEPSLRSDITVGIIEFSGGYLTTDLEKSLKDNGFPNWKASEHVFPKFLNGYPTNVEENFYNDLESSGEVTLDIEVVANCIPNGKIIVYFYPLPSTPVEPIDFNLIVDNIIKDKCTTVSNSWGNFEIENPNNNIFNIDDAFKRLVKEGISLFSATGDNGDLNFLGNPSNNVVGYQVGFPASSPNVIACGGSNLSLALKNGEYQEYSKETSWIEFLETNRVVAGNGGESMIFPQPCYQNGLPYKKRTVPDISGNASVYNGWRLVFNGGLLTVGGTSCVAPMWAGYTGGLGCNVFLNHYLYKMDRKNFHDITEGIDFPFEAKKGYDLCTGLGTPNAKCLTPTLLNIFKNKRCKCKCKK